LRVELQKAIDDLKNYLEHLPTLSSPEQGQPLILYISAMHSAVSGAQIIEKETTQNNKAAVIGVFHFGGPYRI
jgi:hypothetical protein